jgi:hypothetical protein
MGEGKPVASAEAKPAARATGDTIVRVRAEKPYKNGMNAAGLPAWREGEVREVSLANLKQLQEDAPGNWTLEQ